MAYKQKDLAPLVRGDDWVIKLTITQDGSVLDITGFTYWFTIKSDKDDIDPGELQVTAVPANAQDAAAGIVYVKAPRAQTQDIEAKTYNYDIQQLDDNDTMQTLVIGKVQVVKDITRAVS